MENLDQGQETSDSASQAEAIKSSNLFSLFRLGDVHLHREKQCVLLTLKV